MSRRRARGEPHSAMDGSLCDHPVRKLLERCERHRLTGVLDVTSWGRSGRVEMRAGQITRVAFGTLQGHAAMAELHALRDGLFELHQELPHVEAGGQRRERLPLSAVLEQCRTRALSCRVEVVSRKQRAVITYRAGELEHLEVDGGPLPEGLHAADVLAPFEHGQVRVEALPLSLHESAGTDTGVVQAPRAAGAQGSSAHQVPRPAGREDSRPARSSHAAREDSRPNRVHAAPVAVGEDSRPNRVHAAPPPPPLAAREDSRPNRVHAAPPPPPLAAREGSRPNRVHAPREDSRPNRIPAAREDSRPHRVHAAPPPPPLAAREGSRPNRVHAPPPLAAHEHSRPNHVHAAPPPSPSATREDSRPNRAPAAGARPVPRPKAGPVANPTLRPVPLDPSSNAPIPVALGRAPADGAGTASGVGPWLDSTNPSGAIASPRNALGSRRELALPALLTVIVLSLLIIIGVVALQP